MKEYFLVPKKDIEGIRNALFDLKAFLKYNAKYGDFTKNFLDPMSRVANTKYKVCTDFQEKDDENKSL